MLTLARTGGGRACRIGQAREVEDMAEKSKDAAASAEQVATKYGIPVAAAEKLIAKHGGDRAALEAAAKAMAR